MMTLRGAARILGLFGGIATEASLAFASGLRTQTNRAGHELEAVGHHFMSS